MWRCRVLPCSAQCVGGRYGGGGVAAALRGRRYKRDPGDIFSWRRPWNIHGVYAVPNYIFHSSPPPTLGRVTLNLRRPITPLLRSSPPPPFSPRPSHISRGPIPHTHALHTITAAKICRVIQVSRDEGGGMGSVVIIIY